MNKQYSYNYYQKIKNRKTIRKIAILNSLLFLFQVSFGAALVVNSIPSVAQAETRQNLCSVAVDTVLIIDRSGSMEDGKKVSRCDWEELELVDETYQWVAHSEENVSEAECAEHLDRYPPADYTPATPSKLDYAKQAANNFLVLMGSNDQSSLVSFASDALLNKSLSNNHASTQAAVNSLTEGGSTNIGLSISLANDELMSGRANSQAVKSMILLTDGKANKPLGTGDGEDPLDLAYAMDMAEIAASNGFKIFTIGLGSDVNSSMLQGIANLSGANYYYAPSVSDLNAIYTTISQRLCSYGSISGCKYNDVNGDGNIGGDPKISAWTINLSGASVATQKTDAEGCFSFTGLEAGTYEVSEANSSDYIQTYPVTNKSYSVTLDPNENQVAKDVKNIDFGNYKLPICGDNSVNQDHEQCDDGNQINNDGCSTECQIESDENYPLSVSGYKYQDTDGDASTTEDWTGLDNWTIELFDIVASSTRQATTSENGYYEFSNVASGDYRVTEIMQAGWKQLLAPLGDLIIDRASSTNNIFVNYLFPYCGDGLVNQTIEQCDDSNNTDGDGCSANCALEGNTGPSCGNGIVENGEVCDDGSKNGSSGYCNSNCSDSSSGNGGGGGGGSTPFWILEKMQTSSLPTASEKTEVEKPIVLGEEGTPHLKIEKKVKEELANPGDLLNYTIIVSNTGNLDAFNVKVVDDLPVGLVFEENKKSNYSWQIGTLAPSAKKEIKYQVRVSSDAKAAVYTNIAIASSDNNPSVSARAEVEVIEPKVLAETGINYFEYLAILFISLCSILVAKKFRGLVNE